MKTGITHLIASKTPLDEFFAQSAAAGYDVVELVMRREGELTPATPVECLASIAEKARARGVGIVSMCHSHMTGNLLEDGEAGKTAIDETATGLRAAKSLGAHCTLHTLGRLRPDLYYEDAYRNAVANLKELASVCAETGVALAVEFVWNGFLFSPVEMRRFLDEVASEHVGFYFDPGNMAVFQFPQHWVRACAPHIKMVHMKDWKGRALKGEWTPLLAGDVDFTVVMKELRAAGYDGPLISEVSTDLASLADTAAAISRIAAL